jgi:hypothetical protein
MLIDRAAAGAFRCKVLLADGSWSRDAAGLNVRAGGACKGACMRPGRRQ